MAFEIKELLLNVITYDRNCDGTTWFACWDGTSLKVSEPTRARQESIASLLNNLKEAVCSTASAQRPTKKAPKRKK